jgi:predicted 2-oxoglutarate/Fe(II)-dependent dioxygenase YbiX
MISLNIDNAKDIDAFIFKVVNKLLKEFTDTCPDFKGIHDNGYTLRRIHGGTKRHVDGVHSKTGGFTKFVRALSFIAVLNDDYDGGIFNFPNQNLKFKLKKGEVVLFPPYWTHPHSVTSVGEGQARYTINTWILEKFVD